MAPCNQWHPAMAPRPLHPALAFWCHVQCKRGSSPSPPIGSKNPYSYRYLGKEHKSSLLFLTSPLKQQQKKVTTRGTPTKTTPPGCDGSASDTFTANGEENTAAATLTTATQPDAWQVGTMASHGGFIGSVGNQKSGKNQHKPVQGGW